MAVTEAMVRKEMMAIMAATAAEAAEAVPMLVQSWEPAEALEAAEALAAEAEKTTVSHGLPHPALEEAAVRVQTKTAVAAEAAVLPCMFQRQ